MRFFPTLAAGKMVHVRSGRFALDLCTLELAAKQGPKAKCA